MSLSQLVDNRGFYTCYHAIVTTIELKFKLANGNYFDLFLKMGSRHSSVKLINDTVIQFH